jgi:hypothetical protein
MTRRATFTAAELERALKTAHASHRSAPRAVTFLYSRCILLLRCDRSRGRYRASKRKRE